MVPYELLRLQDCLEQKTVLCAKPLLVAGLMTTGKNASPKSKITLVAKAA